MQTSDTPIATPQQRQAIRRNQVQRLRNQAEALLRAVEDLDAPKTWKEAEQASKTLIAVDKILTAVYELNGEDERCMPASNRPIDPAAEREALTSWSAALDKSLDLLTETSRLNRERDGA